jgi:hypothetical protein
MFRGHTAGLLVPARTVTIQLTFQMTILLAPGSTLDHSVLVHFRIAYAPYSMYYPQGGRYTSCVTEQAPHPWLRAPVTPR